MKIRQWGFMDMHPNFSWTRIVLRIAMGTAVAFCVVGCDVRRIGAHGQPRERIVQTNTPVTPGLDFCASQIAMLSDGTVYVARPYNGSLQKISPTGLVSDLHLHAWGLTKDDHDNVYVYVKGAVMMISPNGTWRTLAGQADDEMPDRDRDGPAHQARFAQFHSMAVDQEGNVYIRQAKIPDSTIRKISAAGVVSTIFIGSVGTISNNWEHTAFAVDSRGNLYFGVHGAIVKAGVDGKISTFAGTEAIEQPSEKDGQGSEAVFGAPITDIAIDAKDNLYVVVHSGRSFIRKISPSGEVTTLAGKFATDRRDTDPFQHGDLVDGSERGNPFYPRSNLQVDSQGNVFFLECNVNALRKLSSDGQIVTVMRGFPNPTSW